MLPCKTCWSTKAKQRWLCHRSHHGHEGRPLTTWEGVTGLVEEKRKRPTPWPRTRPGCVRDVLERKRLTFSESEVKARREDDLKNAEKGKVVLRFAPNPNGPLSFGHARGLVINSSYRETYEGEFILRFDDTDTKVKPPMLEAYNIIQEETEWLTGRKPDRVIFASDRIEEYYSHATTMLEEGFGYVCRCTADEFKEFRISKTNCPCRSQPISDNLVFGNTCWWSI